MKELKIATLFNGAIFLMAVLGTVFTLFEVKMTGADNTTFGISAFKFFTVQSNVIMGVFTVYGILLLTKKYPKSLRYYTNLNSFSRSASC